MTELQFKILDELYFVISFGELQSELSMDDKELCDELMGLFLAGWLRVFKHPNDTRDIEVISDDIIKNSYLLASKAGLKAHNS